MSGTLEGGRKAAATNKAKYGKEFYANIGRKGGRNGHAGGFASLKVGKDGLTGAERAKLAGAKGGKLGKRGSAKRGHKVLNANYTLDEIDKKVKLLNIELERLRHEITQ